jgi:hypothetical protein
LAFCVRIGRDSLPFTAEPPHAVSRYLADLARHRRLPLECEDVDAAALIVCNDGAVVRKIAPLDESAFVRVPTAAGAHGAATPPGASFARRFVRRSRALQDRMKA